VNKSVKKHKDAKHLRRRRISDEKRKNRNKSLQGLSKSEADFIKQFRDYNKISAPIHFSFVKSTEKTVEFIIKIERSFSIISLAIENGYVDKNDNLVNSLKDEVTNIWETLTDTPPLIDKTASKEVIDGIATLRAEKISKVENIIIEIEKIVFKLIITINKG